MLGSRRKLRPVGLLAAVGCAAAMIVPAGTASAMYPGRSAARWTAATPSPGTAPVLVDLTGDGVESVSWASASFCMAVDWNGNALSWNGAPAPIAGGSAWRPHRRVLPARRLLRRRRLRRPGPGAPQLE
jgi:hypothetical protein